MKEVIFNVLENAFKFTSEGEIVIRSYIDKTALHFEIIDSGIGVEDNELVRIFDL